MGFNSAFKGLTTDQSTQHHNPEDSDLQLQSFLISTSGPLSVGGT